MARKFRIRHPQIVIAAIVFCAGIFVGWAFIPYTGLYPTSATVTDAGVRLSGQYKLVSPLLLCSSTEATNYSQSSDLKNKLDSEIAAAKASGAATDVSVYFRDFSGHWLGINDTEQYAPASLLKVPIMIAYLKESEEMPGLLSEELTYDGSFDENSAEEIKSPNDIKPGTYTISELIKAMVENSDNNALILLQNNMNKAWLSEVYSDLGLSLTPDDSEAAENITAKQYSYFFRILYNATYLTPEDSEKALEYLGVSDFPQGLTSTVPAGVTVADKFGERTVFSASGVVQDRELHDCGIAYLPGKPYLVCIMTRGKDFGQLTSVIQTISKTVYQQMASR